MSTIRDGEFVGPVPLRLPRRVHERLQAIAEKEKTTMSAVARFLVLQGLKIYEKRNEKTKEDGR